MFRNIVIIIVSGIGKKKKERKEKIARLPVRSRAWPQVKLATLRTIVAVKRDTCRAVKGTRARRDRFGGVAAHKCVYLDR